MSIIDNLISYWKLDESSGNAVDSVGSNTLTNTNTATFGAGKINNGTTLARASSQRFLGGTTSALQPASALTFSMWIYVNASPVSYCAIAGNTLSGNQRGYLFDMAVSGKYLSFQIGNGTWGIVSTTYTVGSWTHIVGTWDGETVRLYKNGTEVGTPVAKASITYTDCGFSLGTYYNDTTSANMFDGMIDEVGVWNRALSSTEVIKLYNSGLGSTYPFAPMLTTETVTNIDLTSATLNGTLVNDIGFTVTEKGFVYSTSQNPTVDDTKIVVAGSSLGSYTGSATGLTANTTYYVRSYATNSIGTGTGYGDQVSFTTLSLGAKKLYLDINGIEGETYTVSLNVGGSAGSVSVKLGSTSTAHVINAGDGVTVFSDVYSGLSGLIIESSEGFVGTVDDVFYVLTLGDAVIDWALNSLTNVIAINSSVTFKRIEDKEITRFNLYRYLDTQFKDLDGYVTVTILEEKNDLSYSKSKQFLVGNTGTTVSPFVKKRISMLSKNQAILITLSNNKLNETFTICQYSLTGFKEPRKLYKLSKIISI